MAQSTTSHRNRLSGILALTAAITLIAIAVATSDNPLVFVDWRAFTVVTIGTALVAAISFSWDEMVTSVRIMIRSLLGHRSDLSETATHVLKIAEKSRKSPGKLPLSFVSKKAHPELARTLELFQDGLENDVVDQILEQEIAETIRQRHASSRLFRRAAEVAPAMGLIGTLIGLVQMLGSIQNPDAIGPAMSIALLTTLYGAILGNVVLLPIATRIEHDTSSEMSRLALYRAGAKSINKKENPRRLEIVFNSLLPPEDRVKYFN